MCYVKLFIQNMAMSGFIVFLSKSWINILELWRIILALSNKSPSLDNRQYIVPFILGMGETMVVKEWASIRYVLAFSKCDPLFAPASGSYPYWLACGNIFPT